MEDVYAIIGRDGDHNEMPHSPQAIKEQMETPDKVDFSSQQGLQPSPSQPFI
jgi:hypothetical protein